MRPVGRRRPPLGTAGLALLGLIGLGIATALVERAEILAVPALAAAIGLAIAHRSIAAAWRSSRMALLLVALTALLQGATEPDGGIVLFLRFSALVCAAQMVTTLWSWSALCDAMIALLWPLDRMRLIDAERAAFTLMLAVRFVPVMQEEIAEIREAQALRGLDRSIFALAVPLALRILLRAEEIAEAVELRAPPPRRAASAVRRSTAGSTRTSELAP